MTPTLSLHHPLTHPPTPTPTPALHEYPPPYEHHRVSFMITFTKLLALDGLLRQPPHLAAGSHNRSVTGQLWGSFEA